MPTKLVFGHSEGDKRKQVELFGDFPEGKLWVIKTEQNIALEKDGKLYRLGWIGHNDRNFMREKFRDVATKGGLYAQMKSVVDGLVKVSKENRADIIKADLRVTHANPNFFALLGRMEEYQAIIDNNEAVKKVNQDRMDKEAAEATKLLQAEREDLRNKTKIAILNDEMVDPEDLISLAQEYDVKIPLRTHGWLLDKCIELSSDTMRYNKVKGGKASQTACKVYRDVRDAIKASV